MKYDNINNECYNLYSIKTDKFKTCHMEVVFRNKCSKEYITYSALLFDVLMENNQKYKTRKLLTRKEQELYNLGIYSVISRVGNNIFANVISDFLDPEYMDEALLDEIIALTFDMIFNPNLVNGVFNEETFDKVKKRLLIEIESLKENPKKMSILSAFNYLDSNSPFAFNSCGDKEILESITPKKLFDFYKKVLDESLVDVYFIGNIDIKVIDKIVKKYAQFTSIKMGNIHLYLDEVKSHKLMEKMDKSKLTQMQVVQIYALNDLDSFEVNYVMPIFNMLFGSGSLESKIYKSLRSDNALCYNVQTFYQKYDKTLFLHTAIESKNYKLALKLIRKAFVSMMHGEISDEELNNVKNIMINSLNIVYDSPTRLIDNYLFSNIADLPDLDTRIEQFKKVTIDDLIRVSKKITLVLNYRMGDKNEKN